jgi:hypothetical protein
MKPTGRRTRVAALAVVLSSWFMTACDTTSSSVASPMTPSAAARTHLPIVKPTDTAALDNGISPSSQPPRIGGLFQVHQAPFGTSIWRVDNQWDGPVGQVWLQVYAGGPTTPDGGTVAHGAVRLLSLPSDPNAQIQNETDLGDFAPSPDVGALTIKSVSGDTMTLTDPTGKVIQFNLITDRFSN